ncbi:MAG: hypothetical protein NC453_28015 [Muribaculum sp.]|nr:hypothetical protein [Muribaculum sp.]
MNKKIQIYPSKDSVYLMYKYLSDFEYSISKCTGSYNFDSMKLNQFLIDNDIELRPVSKSSRVIDLPRNNYIVFLYGDHKTEYDDKAHDLLRHIRNSIGHALIVKTSTNKAIFDITDRNKNGNITLRGNIQENLFFALIQKLIYTKE